MPLPKEPTDAPPGTKRKVEVMQERVAKGEAPTHPLDAKDLKDAEDEEVLKHPSSRPASAVADRLRGRGTCREIRQEDN